MNPDQATLPDVIRRAMVAFDDGDWAQAEQLCREAIEIHPGCYDALNLLGFLAARFGQPREAAALLGRAVAANPTSVAALNNYGVMLHKLNRPDEALACYEKAIALAPHSAEAHNNRGSVLRELNRLDEAVASCSRAIALDPNHVDAYNNRGTALQKLYQWEGALACYEQAIRLKPDFAPAFSNRGYVLAQLNRFDEALQSCERAIALAPHSADAHNNRGIALQELNQLVQAVASFDQAIRLNPDYAEAYSNRGVVLTRLQQPESALASFDRAIAIRPDYADAHWNKAVALLLGGQLHAGWELFEWRWRRERRFPSARDFAQPLWLGKDPLEGRTVLLHAEQGLGDTIQFCRYATLVGDLGGRVILEAPEPLLPLFSTLEGVSELVATGGALPPFHVHCPLMSLPLALRTDLSSIPAPVGYLKADPIKSTYWKRRLGPTSKLRVGLAWAGGFRPNQPEMWGVNNRRNIDLAKLACLRHERIEFFSLQKGQPATTELAKLVAERWDGPQIIDFTNELRDFSDTAALVENLDLVISVDTAIAHLAGAIGKAVWILNRFDTCWRWLLSRDDSPWYPTAKLYRQERLGDWDGVVRRIKVDLDQLIAAR